MNTNNPNINNRIGQPTVLLDGTKLSGGAWAAAKASAHTGGSAALGAQPGPPWGDGTARLYTGSGSLGAYLTEAEVRGLAASRGYRIENEADFAAYLRDNGLVADEQTLLTDASMDESGGDPHSAYGTFDSRDWDSPSMGHFSPGNWIVDKATGQTTVDATQYASYGQEDIQLPVEGMIARGEGPWNNTEHFNSDFIEFMQDTYSMAPADVDDNEDGHPIAGAWTLTVTAPTPPTSGRAIDAWLNTQSRLDETTNNGTMGIAFDRWAENKYAGLYRRPRADDTPYSVAA